MKRTPQGKPYQNRLDAIASHILLLKRANEENPRTTLLRDFIESILESRFLTLPDEARDEFQGYVKEFDFKTDEELMVVIRNVAVKLRDSFLHICETIVDEYYPANPDRFFDTLSENLEYRDPNNEAGRAAQRIAQRDELRILGRNIAGLGEGNPHAASALPPLSFGRYVDPARVAEVDGSVWTDYDRLAHEDLYRAMFARMNAVFGEGDSGPGAVDHGGASADSGAAGGVERTVGGIPEVSLGFDSGDDGSDLDELSLLPQEGDGEEEEQTSDLPDDTPSANPSNPRRDDDDRGRGDAGSGSILI